MKPLQKILESYALIVAACDWQLVVQAFIPIGFIIMRRTYGHFDGGGVVYFPHRTGTQFVDQFAQQESGFEPVLESVHSAFGRSRRNPESIEPGDDFGLKVCII